MNECRRVGTVASFPRGRSTSGRLLPTGRKKALVGGMSLWNFLCARESGRIWAHPSHTHSQLNVSPVSGLGEDRCRTEAQPSDSSALEASPPCPAPDDAHPVPQHLCAVASLC